jgi:hypothetical protein
VKRAVLFGALALVGCSTLNRRDVQTALDVAQIACVIAHAESDDATVQEICQVADVLMPDVRRVLAEQRAASRRFADAQYGHCHDGGRHGSK